MQVWQFKQMLSGLCSKVLCAGVVFQDTMDFVAYVAKDDIHGRACHVIECGGGLAQDVITTIGQAFELRFKNYLAQRAVPLNVQSRYVRLCLLPLNTHTHEIHNSFTFHSGLKVHLFHKFFPS